jgi:hypothetical protein
MYGICTDASRKKVTTQPVVGAEGQARRGCGGCPWKVRVRAWKRLTPCLCECDHPICCSDVHVRRWFVRVIVRPPTLGLRPRPRARREAAAGDEQVCPSGKTAKHPEQGRRNPPAIKYLHFQLTFHAQIGYGAAHAHAPEGPTPADFRRRSRLHPPADRRSSGVESQDRVEAGV